jgi:hypothetical protein
MSYIIFIFVIIVFHIIVDFCVKHDSQVSLPCQLPGPAGKYNGLTTD